MVSYLLFDHTHSPATENRYLAADIFSVVKLRVSNPSVPVHLGSDYRAIRLGW
jgi:hypothetical protein